MGRSRSRAPTPNSGRPLRVADEWVGGRLQMPAYIMENEPFRPDIALWMDATHDLVVGHKIVTPETPPDVTVDLLLRTFEQPMAGRPRRPARIRVANAELAELVRNRVSDIPVEVAPTPELEGFLAKFSQSIRLGKDEGSYLRGGKVAAATMARFFEAAANLYRAAPWRHLFDSQLLWLDSPDLSIRSRCISVIGNLGESFGLLIFDSVAAFETMAERGEAIMAGEKIDLGTSIFSINFDRGSDIPKGMRREVAEHHWEVVDANAYPHIQWIDPDRLLRPLTDHDVDCATACAAGVAAFFTKHGAAIAEGSFSAARERFTIDALPGQPTVEVAAPHPEKDWPADDGDDADLDAEMRRGREIAKAFLATESEAGRSASWLDAAPFVVEDLYQFKIQYADGRADGWTAALVEEYLLDYFPRKVSADDELIALVPEVAAAFFAWLAAGRGITARTGEAIRKRIAQKTKAFVRTANDPARFGMAKSFVMAMKDAGVDLSNQDEVARYLEGCEAPDPQKPCPCGSGKRYETCCMPR